MFCKVGETVFNVPAAELGQVQVLPFELWPAGA